MFTNKSVHLTKYSSLIITNINILILQFNIEYYIIRETDTNIFVALFSLIIICTVNIAVPNYNKTTGIETYLMADGYDRSTGREIIY